MHVSHVIVSCSVLQHPHAVKIRLNNLTFCKYLLIDLLTLLYLANLLPNLPNFCITSVLYCNDEVCNKFAAVFRKYANYGFAKFASEVYSLRVFSPIGIFFNFAKIRQCL
jgi:hypothetical protein